LRASLRPLLIACRDHWQAEGVDLAAYNTVENAADLNDLRLALGYGKVTLVGGSYGSHLALQVLRQYPRAVERIVLYGVEGPDHTWDDPAGVLATLGRIAAAAERSPVFSQRIPRTPPWRAARSE
jgi:pimeloyl-ACP methyl ester carboxylesterase